MAFTTQDHYDAESYTHTFHTSGFERNLMNLLAVADRYNVKIIEDNWGHIIKRMANDYREYGIKKEKLEGEQNES